MHHRGYYQSRVGCNGRQYSCIPGIGGWQRTRHLDGLNHKPLFGSDPIPGIHIRRELAAHQHNTLPRPETGLVWQVAGHHRHAVGDRRNKGNALRLRLIDELAEQPPHNGPAAKKFVGREAHWVRLLFDSSDTRLRYGMAEGRTGGAIEVVSIGR
jgi:hypothetical protein